MITVDDVRRCDLETGENSLRDILCAVHAELCAQDRRIAEVLINGSLFAPTSEDEADRMLNGNDNIAIHTVSLAELPVQSAKHLLALIRLLKNGAAGAALKLREHDEEEALRMLEPLFSIARQALVSIDRLQKQISELGVRTILHGGEEALVLCLEELTEAVKVRDYAGMIKILDQALKEQCLRWENYLPKIEECAVVKG
ncbi:MAG: hypothetical protein PUB69_03615 [Desulfovibrionaceae bacterium]|nr:hypothetical protein [Desulfovibrionaceae bacterium]